MDINMPVMDGIESTKNILKTLNQYVSEKRNNHNNS